MRNILSGIKSVVLFYVMLGLLLAAAIFFTALYETYITTIYLGNGEAVSSYQARQYAEGFEQHISMENGIPQVSEAGRAVLEKYNLWVQILDDDGSQVAEYFKPDEIPKEYSISDLLEMADQNRFDGHTLFAMSTLLDEASHVYVMGFPFSITKVTRYYNSDRYIGVMVTGENLVRGMGALVIVAGLLYGIWLIKHLTRITRSAGAISERTYIPERTGGAFGEAYKSLNRLDGEIRQSDEIRADTDRMREEWIANITHDLKTPLSPIKGYAELLVDAKYDTTPDEINKYGQIILKNTVHTEQLINDLKLTYQLESGIMPAKLEMVNLARAVKEIVIDIANNPEFAGRTLQYQCDESTILADVDKALLRRMISNIVINAIIHNPPTSEVTVSVASSDDVTISVSDNGKGLSEEEARNLFTRYYRGTGTEEKPQGSGLGLAIAKQIALLHGGDIEIESTLGKGTDIIIHLTRQEIIKT